MTLVTRWSVAAAVAAAALVRSPAAEACACCTEPGQRMESTAPFSGYEAGEIAKIRFGSAASLYLTAAGFEGVRGLEPSTTSGYAVTATSDGRSFTFTMKHKDGKSGTLTFAPKNVESFFVDLRDGKRGAEPLLYKEWRLSAPVVATGMFSPSVAGPATPPTARLVLQGRGNSCTDASQFTHWMLIVSGRNADYRFFGDLRAPAP